MKRNLFVFISAIILMLACNKSPVETEIKTGFVQITGKIDDYKGIFRTGKLTYFDGITRTVNEKIFKIDDSGTFILSFDLTHPITGSIFFDIENEYYSGFYIEPNEDYHILLKDGKLFFTGDNAGINTEIKKYRDTLYSILSNEIKAAEFLHEKGLPMDEYVNAQKTLEETKLRILEDFITQKYISKEAFEVIEKEIKFKTAHSWICYRYDYSQGWPKIREGLPSNFLEQIINQYPIKNIKDIESRNCIDYISNIIILIEEKNFNANKKIGFIKKTKEFSENEMKIVEQIIKRNREIYTSNEYDIFNTEENQKKLTYLGAQYNLQALLSQLENIKPDFGRDILISQSISKNFFENNISPKQSDWDKIEKSIGNKSLYNYLKNFNYKKTPYEDEITEELKTNIEEIIKKYINPYTGKIIYIDFYSTWCGPCRTEIPFAKKLYEKYSGKNIVFLNLCAQSNKENWENHIKQKEIKGENFLLTNEEYNLFAKLYHIKGFPTYVIIGKQGEVINNNAPRPSNTIAITQTIEELIKVQ